jgi:acyl-CoA reductase-like NAD-dependent aldehyde dehydrogenase
LSIFIAGVDNRMTIAREEIFGPVLHAETKTMLIEQPTAA